MSLPYQQDALALESLRNYAGPTLHKLGWGLEHSALVLSTTLDTKISSYIWERIESQKMYKSLQQNYHKSVPI